MKRLFVIVCIMLFAIFSIFFSGTLAAQEYTFDDTVSYNFEDISATGTNLSLTDDSYRYIPLPFTFDFYTESYNWVIIGANGKIYFSNISHDYSNRTIPYNTSIDTFIAPFWDDLNPSSGGAVYWEVRGTAPERRLIVQWHQVPHYYNYGAATFQAILYEGSNNILFQYADVQFENSSYNNGISATVGLQENSSSGLQYSYNAASLYDGLAILFIFYEVSYQEYTYDDMVSYSFEDISSTGTNLFLSDDGYSSVSLPFTFTFYSTDYNIVTIGSNGKIYFSYTYHDYYNGCIPVDTYVDTFIAPFWDDLNPSSGGAVYWEVRGTAPERRLIVQWHQVPLYYNYGAGTFQAILYEGSNNILFQYADVQFGDSSYNNGVSATVGLQKNPTSGLQYSCNTASLSDSLAIKFIKTSTT